MMLAGPVRARCALMGFRQHMSAKHVPTAPVSIISNRRAYSTGRSRPIKAASIDGVSSEGLHGVPWLYKLEKKSAIALAPETPSGSPQASRGCGDGEGRTLSQDPSPTLAAVEEAAISDFQSDSVDKSPSDFPMRGIAAGNGRSAPGDSSDDSDSPDNGILSLPKKLDAIIVLAGGQTQQGGNPAWVERRLEVAVGLLKAQSRENCPVLCLGGGTPHKPPILGSDGYVIHESTSCATYLMEKGIPASRILKEVSSYDTVGNAFFALTIHAIPASWKRVAIVTSDFHMERTRSLFEEMWSKAAQDLHGNPNRYTMWYASASDEGLFEQPVLVARQQKEAAALENWKQVSEGLNTLSDVHAWFFATHRCYSVGRQHEFSEPTIEDKSLLASY